MKGIRHNVNSGHDQTMGCAEWPTCSAPHTQLSGDYARLYREAQEANRLKDEFLALVAHELRTPLAAVLGWTQILRSKKHDEATADRALDVIERNAQAQAQLIEDLLDLARVTSGKLRLDIRPVDPAAVIEAAVNTVRPAAEASGGRVMVRLEREGSRAAIVVSDTGRGISPGFLPYLFDRLRQADGASKRAGGGLGLGLALVQDLVMPHGGTVQAQSGGEGQGAVFTVTLPLAAFRAGERGVTQGERLTRNRALGAAYAHR